VQSNVAPTTVASCHDTCCTALHAGLLLASKAVRPLHCSKDLHSVRSQ
jgi:hypothetical protein